MFSWLCTFLPLSGCTESESENTQSPQRDEPLFSIQDVRSPLLTPENCLSGSQLQMVKTESLERYFCATKEGILVGPSIEKNLALEDRWLQIYLVHRWKTQSCPFDVHFKRAVGF